MKMGSNYLAILGVTTVTTVMSCSPAKKEYASFELYPVRTGSLTEMEYTPVGNQILSLVTNCRRSTPDAI